MPEPLLLCGKIISAPAVAFLLVVSSFHLLVVPAHAPLPQAHHLAVAAVVVVAAALGREAPFLFLWRCVVRPLGLHSVVA